MIDRFYVANSQKYWFTHHCILEIVYALYKIGIWRDLMNSPRGVSVKDLSSKFKVSERMLDAVLLYLRTNTSFVEKQGSLYRLGGNTRNWRTDYLINIFGAYRPVFTNLAGLMRGELEYGKDVTRDGEMLQRGAYYLTKRAIPIILKKLLEHNIKSVIDLGCGSAGLLMSFCRSQPLLRGVGIDVDPKTVVSARNNISMAGFSERIGVVEGDVEEFSTLQNAILSIKDLEPERNAVVAMGVLHEFFRGNEKAVVSLLKNFGRAFSGSVFIVAEFDMPPYEEIHEHTDEDFKRFASLYKLIHPLSMQGDPQPRKIWEKTFLESGMQLASVDKAGKNFTVYTLRM